MDVNVSVENYLNLASYSDFILKIVKVHTYIIYNMLHKPTYVDNFSGLQKSTKACNMKLDMS